jgi:hypothetical protein
MTERVTSASSLCRTPGKRRGPSNSMALKALNIIAVVENFNKKWMGA